MPQVEVRGVEGGIEPATLSGGNDDMIIETATSEGKMGSTPSIE